MDVTVYPTTDAPPPPPPTHTRTECNMGGERRSKRQPNPCSLGGSGAITLTGPTWSTSSSRMPCPAVVPFYDLLQPNRRTPGSATISSPKVWVAR